jgi:hypothetical protein
VPHDVDDAVDARIIKGQSPQVLLREMQELLGNNPLRLFPSEGSLEMNRTGVPEATA